ncbi:MAG: hypothetical protein ACP5IZ_11660 [Thermoprotei archaeon]
MMENPLIGLSPHPAPRVSGISLRGFFLTVHCPTEELLNVTIDATSLNPSEFFALIQELQELLRNIDEFYAVNRELLRGRSVHAKHWRAFHYDERRRIIRFAPFPSAYINKLKTIRRELYDIINENAILIYSDGLRNTYLLPYETSESFTNKIEKLNTKINDLRSKVEAFINSNDFFNISYIFEKRLLAPLKPNPNIPNITIRLIPVNLENIDIEKWAEFSPSVAEILRQTKEDYIKRVLLSLQEKLLPIITELEKQRNLENIKAQLEKIKRIVESVGMNAIAESIIIPLINITEGKVKTKTETTERIKAMLKNLTSDKT